MSFSRVVEDTLYLLVLINPISKIFILSVLADQFPRPGIRRLILRSTLYAAAILLVLGVGGNLVLERVFHVQLHSLKVGAGIVLFFVGYTALTRGVFFEVDEKSPQEDLSLVPLASPMIAGPATIAASISLNTQEGHLAASLCILLALALNYFVMTLHRWVTSWMVRYQLMGALIRITGLIVASIGVEMVFSGIEDWLRQMRSA